MSSHLEPWRVEAACSAPDVELEWFFPVDGRGIALPDLVPPEAAAVCRRCPVRDECLAYALADPDCDGVWGGTSKAQRLRLRKRAALHRRRNTA